MFKDKSPTEKLIEYIQALPHKEQSLIIEHISKSGKNKSKKKTVTVRATKNKGVKEMGAFLDKLGTKLPENFKFNRDEANER